LTSRARSSNVKSNKSPSLDEVEARIREKSSKDHEVEIDLIEELLNSLLGGFGQLGSSVTIEDPRLWWTLLRTTTRAFNSLRCAYEHMKTGYYSQALTLIRSVGEDYIFGRYYLAFPNELPAFLKGERPPTWRHMADKLGDEGKSWYDVYGEQSQFAHTRKRALQVLLDPESRTLRLGAHYDQLLLTWCAVDCVQASLQIHCLLAQVLEERGKAWVDRTTPLIKHAAEWHKHKLSSLADQLLEEPREEEVD